MIVNGIHAFVPRLTAAGPSEDMTNLAFVGIMRGDYWLIPQPGALNRS
jgi:hypothetical protein